MASVVEGVNAKKVGKGAEVASVEGNVGGDATHASMVKPRRMLITSLCAIGAY